ncbi:hypothetical protein [Enterococcus sp. AZ072]|uniref:hypothetical protein n=1 Tax=unclassified Enterococcus TaxID=2608891 RepID=UPI003D2D1B9A
MGNPLVSDYIESVLLECECFSKNWEKVCHQIDQSAPPENQVLSLVLPIPERSGTILFSETSGYSSPYQSLATLKNDKTIHNFLDYAALSHALKRFSCFGAKAMPLVNLRSVLFPVGRARNASWINPLMIEQLEEKGPFTQIQLINGLTIEVAASSQSICTRAEAALSVLSMIERDYLIAGKTGPHSPLDVLRLPDTPFARSMSRKPLLQKFPLLIRALRTAYEQEYALQTLLRFGHTIEGLDWIHESFHTLPTE